MAAIYQYPWSGAVNKPCQTSNDHWTVERWPWKHDLPFQGCTRDIFTVNIRHKQWWVRAFNNIPFPIRPLWQYSRKSRHKGKNCAGWDASSDPFKDISFISNNAPVNPHSQPFPTPGHAENPLLVGRTNLRLRRTQGSLYRLQHQYACFLKESFYLNSWNLTDMRGQRYSPYCY